MAGSTLPEMEVAPEESTRTVCYDWDCSQVEAWLDDHPEFAYDYFIR